MGLKILDTWLIIKMLKESKQKCGTQPGNNADYMVIVHLTTPIHTLTPVTKKQYKQSIISLNIYICRDED